MNRREFLEAAAGCGCLVGADWGGPAAAQDMTTVTGLCDSFLDRYMAINPTLTGRVFGLNRSDAAVSDWSPAGVARIEALMLETLAALDTTPPADRKEALGAAFLEDTARAILSMIEAGEPWRKMSTHIFIGPQALLLTSFTQMARATPGEVPLEPETVDADWGRILARMQAVPEAMAGYRASLKMGLARNLTAPRAMTLAVAEQCRDWAGWFTDFAASYGEGPLRPALAEAGRAADAAYADLARWLTEVYAPQASPEDGIGAERYRLYADLWLGLNGLDLDEAYAWSVAEYRRLEAEKAQECARLRPGASFAEIRAKLDRDPAQRIEGVEAFRAWLQAAADDARDRLSGTEFDIPAPLRPCTIQMTEGAATGAMPYYVAPAEDFSRPGGVVWPTLGRSAFPTWSALSTVYHESVPGHHIQLGGSRLLNLVRLQRVAGAAGHAEGWALYAERLMDELGWFDTPQTRLGFLSMQSFRAARVFVDIGLHTGRPIPDGFAGAGEPWTRERAIAVIDAASGLGQEAAALEVARYYAWPAQACAYKLGERTWLAGRAAAMAREGEAFDRRAWHAKALALGPLGLDRLTDELARL